MTETIEMQKPKIDSKHGGQLILIWRKNINLTYKTVNEQLQNQQQTSSKYLEFIVFSLEISEFLQPFQNLY